MIKANLLDHANSLVAVGHGPFPELLERLFGCGNRLIDGGENPGRAGSLATGRGTRASHLGKHLLDDITDQVFCQLHGVTRRYFGSIDPREHVKDC